MIYEYPFFSTVITECYLWVDLKKEGKDDTGLTGNCNLNLHDCYWKFVFHWWNSLPPPKLHQIVFLSVESFPPNIFSSMENTYPHFAIGGTKHVRLKTLFKKSFHALEPQQITFPLVETFPPTSFYRSNKSAALKSKTCFHRWKNIRLFPSQLDKMVPSMVNSLIQTIFQNSNYSFDKWIKMLPNFHYRLNNCSPLNLGFMSPKNVHAP